MRRVSVLIILFGICFLSNNLLYAFDTNQVSEDVGLNSIIEELNEYTEGMNLQDISEDLISGKSIEYDTILKNESLTKEKASAILYDTKLKC